MIFTFLTLPTKLKYNDYSTYIPLNVLTLMYNRNAE